MVSQKSCLYNMNTKRNRVICWSLLGLFMFVYGILMVFTKNNTGYFTPLPCTVIHSSVNIFQDKALVVEKLNSSQTKHVVMSNIYFTTHEPILKKTSRTSTVKLHKVSKKHCNSAFEASSSGHWQKQPTNLSSPIWLPIQCNLKVPKPTEVIQILESNNVSRIVFLGDSKTNLLNLKVRELFRCHGPVVQRMAGRCDLNRYLGVKANVSKWLRPRTRQEGPCHFGLSHPGCTDCSSCKALWQRCSVNAKSDLSVEYIPMEFARDVEVQSLKFNTTQEHIVQYLLRTGKPDIIIFNVGVHDLAYANLSSYYDNLLWLTTKFVSNFSKCKILFMNNSGLINSKIPERFRSVTRNAAMQKHNLAANDIMRKLKLPYLDQWTMSNNHFAINNLHNPSATDSVHMTWTFTSQTADMILLEMKRWYQT